MNHTRSAVATLLVLLTAFSAGADGPPEWPNGYEGIGWLSPSIDSHSQPVLKQPLRKPLGIAPSPAEHQELRITGSLEVTQGKVTTLASVEGVWAMPIVDDNAVRVQFSGLDAEYDYVLSLGWWDADDKGRIQSVYMGPSTASMTCVVPATPAKAFFADKATSATMMLPILPAYIADTTMIVEVRREAGPNAIMGNLVVLCRPKKEERKKVLIVTGDDYPGHRWRETAPELASALRQDPRLEVSITEVPAILGSPLLRHYDAVLIHFKNYAERLPLGEAVWGGLRDYLNNGGGVVIAHFGCGAFQEWNDFVQYSGRVWNPKFRAHDPYGPFDVSITDHDHAITKDLKDFSTSDELYTCLDGPTPIRVLCTAVSKGDQKPYPMGFVLEPGKGRVFHCTLGHDLNALRSEGTRALYRRAALWAVGLPAS